jgi:pyrroloquinoline quinone biosynthesis protein B
LRASRRSCSASLRTEGCRTSDAASVSASRRAATRRNAAWSASLGLVDPQAGRRFLIDATPDLEAQVERLGGRPDGILLTHAHIGHYLGLALLGREVLGAKGTPVFCTPSMSRFLRGNRPWSRLLALGNVAIREVEPGASFALTSNLTATAIRVPHRDEDSDTVAYRIDGPNRSLLWLPDIDKWEKWDRRIEELAAEPRLLLFLDGTFFDAGEIPGRSIRDIPHPLVPETVARLDGRSRPGQVFFIHLNHTNRLLWDRAARRQVEKKGFRVAREADKFGL